MAIGPGPVRQANMMDSDISNAAWPENGLEYDGEQPLPPRLRQEKSVEHEAEPIPDVCVDPERRLPPRVDLQEPTPREAEATKPKAQRDQSRSTGSTKQKEAVFKSQPQAASFTLLRQRLRADPATVACGAIAQAAPVLRNARTDLVKVKRVAADILGIAVEAKVNNASLTIATRAAIDMIIYGATVPRLLSSARTLWTRILRAAGDRIALLFPTIFEGVKATTPCGAVQRVIVVLEQWREMAARRALPFGHVNWGELAAAFENVRDRPAIPQDKQPGITRWHRVRGGIKTTIPATMKICVWNGDGFIPRWSAGDFGNVVAEVDPDVLIFQETKTDPSRLQDPWAVRETMFAMGFTDVVWHSSVVKATQHGVMVASKWPLPMDFGIGNDLLDRDGRVITLKHPDYSVLCPYAPCTKWGETEACGKRAIFQECLRDRIIELSKKNPVLLAGDLNIAPTEADCTATFKVPPNATSYDVEADLRIMKKDTVSSCKPWERFWHSRLIEECQLVDVVARKTKGKPPISWAKTPAEFKAGRGMRIDHGLAREEFLDPANRPLIAEATIAPTPYNSDHAPVTYVITTDPAVADRARKDPQAARVGPQSPSVRDGPRDGTGRRARRRGWTALVAAVAKVGQHDASLAGNERRPRVLAHGAAARGAGRGGL